jgi:hypothetical protein
MLKASTADRKSHLLKHPHLSSSGDDGPPHFRRLAE